MPSDHTAQQPVVRQMVQAPVLAIALTGRVDERQIAGFTLRAEAILQRDRDFLREPDADEPGSGKRVTAADQADRFGCGDDLAARAGGGGQ